MAKRARNWGKLFSSYVKQYNKISAKSPVPVESQLSLEEFKAQYTGMYNDRISDVRAGKRVAATNITRDIVARQQMYKYSVKQAREIANQLKDWNVPGVTYKDIRLNRNPEAIQAFWDEVRAQQKIIEDLDFQAKKLADSLLKNFLGARNGNTKI